MRIVISAGPTRERFDAVRFWSNRSTGRMGYALAAAAREAGYQVTLVSGPVTLEPPEGVTRKDFYFWISLLDYLYWITGTALGGLAGNLIAFDTTGLDFALTARISSSASALVGRIA